MADDIHTLAMQLWMEDIDVLDTVHGYEAGPSTAGAPDHDRPPPRGDKTDTESSIPDFVMAFGGGEPHWLQHQQAEMAFLQRQNAGRQRAAGRHDPVARPRPQPGPARQLEHWPQPGPARRPEPWQEPQGKGKGRATGVDCTACSDEIVGELHELKCEHRYCIDCLTQMVSKALGGESDTNFPPKCCTDPIPTDAVKTVLSAADFKKYEERLDDRKQAVQLFCPKPKCSAKLSANDIRAETGTCPRCQTKMCTKCKGLEHAGVCPESELAEVAKKEKWASCPACHRVIMKQQDSCNKMICVCGFRFCYLCGKPTRGPNRYATAAEGGCDCPIYNHDDHPERLQHNDMLANEGPPPAGFPGQFEPHGGEAGPAGDGDGWDGRRLVDELFHQRGPWGGRPVVAIPVPQAAPRQLPRVVARPPPQMLPRERPRWRRQEDAEWYLGHYNERGEWVDPFGRPYI